MSNDQPNPYASPVANATNPTQINLDSKTLAKVEAIVKDAGQFWIAILLCFLCTAVGLVIVGPWYMVRLVQWSSMARQYPMLLDVNAPYGSLPQRFQKSKIKLIIGICFGAFVFVLAVFVMLSLLSIRVAKLSQ